MGAIILDVELLAYLALCSTKQADELLCGRVLVASNYVSCATSVSSDQSQTS